MESARLCPLWLPGCAAADRLRRRRGHPAQATAVTPAAIAEPAPYYTPAPHVYAAGPAAPAAVLVLWPGDDNLARDPALWTAQGFDVVMPQPADIYRLAADQQAALAQLVASAHALANSPIWVVGPGPVIDAALAAPQFGRGDVSGVVMTSVASGPVSCSESFFYSDPGTGAPPKVEFKRSGDCAHEHARDYRAATVGASGAPGAPAKSAAPHRGIRGGEEFAAGRKGAAPRGADQISTPGLRPAAPERRTG